MKKHIIAILIIVLILILAGFGIFLIINRQKVKSMYAATSNFVLSDDTTKLSTQMSQAEDLYHKDSYKRITTLQTIISNIDTFEKDLNTYLVVSKVKASKTKKLSNSYARLTSSRKSLIKTYDEYIVRMSGNTDADGNLIQKLYSELFNQTIEYINDYNSVFMSTSNHVFGSVCKVDTLKQEAYRLYSLGVSDLLNNISNNNFKDLSLINKLNNGIKLVNNNLFIKNGGIGIDNLDGGEFSIAALNFKKYFNASNKKTLIENFNLYYPLSINPLVETSNEKLAVYYAKLIWEV